MLTLCALSILVGGAAFELVRLRGARRRRRRVNRALHELRRPLQATALALSGDRPDPDCAAACLELARAAVAELDAAANDGTCRPDPIPTRIADLVAALERRWRFAAVEVSVAAAGKRVAADPARLGGALDNLVANAIDHGSGLVRVRAVAAADEARFEVRDAGPRRRRAAGGSATEAGADPRHGHGLGVVADVAAAHGGIAEPPRRAADGSTVASLSIPVHSRSA